MVKPKKEQTQFCFKTIVNWCSINILNNALHLMGEQHFNSYFYKKSKSYKVCNGSKNRVCFNIVVGFGNSNTKIQPTLIGIWNHTCAMPIIIFINQMWVYLIYIFLNLNFETITQIKVQMNYKNIYIWWKVVCLFCSNGSWNQGDNDTRKAIKFEIRIFRKIKLTSSCRRPQVVNMKGM
jgi:hypothetical protein